MKTLNKTQKAELIEILTAYDNVGEPDYSDLDKFLSYGEAETDALKAFCEKHSIPLRMDVIREQIK